MMKSLKKLFVMCLTLCMIFSLCACGSSSEEEVKDDAEQVEQENSTNVENEAEENADAEDESAETVAAVFKVHVVDADQNPVAGVMVQMCKDSCVPAMTDAEGVATFSIEDVDGYKLSVLSCPEGYEYAGEAEIYMESGAAEYTIELNGGN